MNDSDRFLCNIPAETLHKVLLEECYGQYPVTVVENVRIPLKNSGLSLSSKVWFPRDTLDGTSFNDNDHFLFKSKGDEECWDERERFAVVLEYIPYRKSDLTARDDFGKYTWLSSHGYVCMRVDIRGTGDSEGLLCDEYSQEEQGDCVELMEWLEEQPWCSGKVAMMGISWGGFNCLQMAYLQPSQLKTVISLCSTDDRYNTDIHYDGGCLTGDGMVSWANLILALNALPPDPRHVSNWNEQWLARLKNSRPWMHNWLDHQKRDAYWKHGSVCQQYSRIKCPVLLIGGWKDAYKDAIFRMLENIDEVKAIVGPWGHDWPHTAVPGPNIDFLKIALKWLDFHLKEVCIDSIQEPRLRAYLPQYMQPRKEAVTKVPGQWIAFDQWSSACTDTYSLVPHLGRLKSQDQTAKDTGQTEIWEDVKFVANIGIDYCAWVEMTFPTNQNGSTEMEVLNFESEALEESLTIFGNADFSCLLKTEQTTKYQVFMVQLLADSFDRKESVVLTYGIQNILDAEKFADYAGCRIIKIKLHAMAQRIPKSSRIILRMSSNFWPYVWPSQKILKMKVLTGENRILTPVLKLPILQEHQIHFYRNVNFNCDRTIMGFTLPTVEESPAKFELHIDSSSDDKSYTRRILNDSGNVCIPSRGCSIANCCREKCQIRKFDATGPQVAGSISATIQSDHLTTLKFQYFDDKKIGHNEDSFENRNEISFLKTVQSEMSVGSTDDATDGDNCRLSGESKLKENEGVDENYNTQTSDYVTRETTVSVYANTSMTMDKDSFLHRSNLSAKLNGNVIFDEKWEKEIKANLFD